MGKCENGIPPFQSKIDELGDFYKWARNFERMYMIWNQNIQPSRSMNYEEKSHLANTYSFYETMEDDTLLPLRA